MKYLIWILLLFTAAAVLTVASHNPAYMLVVYPPYKIELSFTLFVVLWLFSLLLSYGLMRLVLAAVQLPEYVKKFRLARAQAKARELLDETIGAFFEGRYAAAEKAAARAMELGDTSALHPIIAARSAHELREYEKRDAYLEAIEGKKVGDATMRLMATTKFMLDQRDSRAALSALRELKASGVKGHLGALSLELKAQQLAGHWDEVLRVIEQLEKRASIDVTVAAQLRQQAWLAKIAQQDTLDGLLTCMQYIPADFKRRGKVASAAATALIRHGGAAVAQQLLAESLNAQWDSELVTLYGDCQSGNVIAQIEQAEKWLNQHKQDAGLLLALGKLCLHQQLWGKAQSYLDASISVLPSKAAYKALGKLAERLGKTPEASRYYLQATELK